MKIFIVYKRKENPINEEDLFPVIEKAFVWEGNAKRYLKQMKEYVGVRYIEEISTEDNVFE